MARKPNHAWEKRQREIAKAAKKAAKLQRRQAAKDQKQGPGPHDGEYEGGYAPEGAPEAHGDDTAGA